MNLLSLKDVSEKLKVSVITLRRYIKSGQLKAAKVGREYFVTEEDFAAFYEKPRLLNEAKTLVDKALNDVSELQYHVSRQELMHRARDIYKKLGEDTLATRVNYDANVFGYCYTNIFNERASRKTWGRFAPTGSMTDKEGKVYYFPDPTWIDEGMLNNAKERLKETHNPVVVAIYFDLLFEHSKEKDKRPYALGAIDNYIKAAEIQYKNKWYFEFLDSIVRAFEIAYMINNIDKKNETLQIIFNYIETLHSEGNPRYMMELFEVLLKYSDYLNPEQIKDIIKKAKEGADYYGSQKGDNRHLQRSFFDIVEKYYQLSKDKDELLKTKLAVVDSYISEANEKSASGLVEAHFLEEALSLVKKLGDPRKEESTLRKRIEDAYIKSESEMKAVSVEFTITEKEKQDFIKQIFVEDNIESLKRIGYLPFLLPSVKHAEKLTKEMMKKYPLQHIFGVKTIQEGRKITVSSGGLEMNEDHIIQQLSRNFSVSTIFLGFIFDELGKRKVTGKDIAAFLKEADFYKYKNFEAIEEGLTAYDNGMYYSALTILVPQLEELLRNVIRLLGQPTAKTDRQGNQRVITIADILDVPTFKQVLTEDQYWYLRLVLYDKRGPSLRDNIAHGLLKKTSHNKYQCYLVLHILLILTNFVLNKNESAVKPDNQSNVAK